MSRSSKWGWGFAVAVVLATTTLCYAPPFRPPPPPPPVPRPVIPHITTPPRINIPNTGMPHITLPGSTLPRVSIPRSAPQIAHDIRGVIPNRPVEALSQLRSPEVRSALPQAERIALGREAITGLALHLESPGRASLTLREVQAIRKNTELIADLPTEVRTGLDRLAERAERRILTDGIDSVTAKLDRGQWRDASTEAGNRITELGAAGREVESIQFTTRRREVLEGLREVRDLTQKLETLERVETLLEKPAGEASAIRTADLPAKLERPIEGLRGWHEIKSQAETNWKNVPPDVAVIKGSLQRLQRGIEGVTSGGSDRVLVLRLQQELAVKAALEGHPAEYFKLMPESGPADSAKALLRDMKAMALGEGKVETTVGKRALPEPGDGGTATRGPPGLEPLVPEGAREGWRAPVKDSAKADLPPMERAAELAGKLERQAKSALETEKTAASKRLDETRATLRTVHARVIEPEAAERRKIADVEAELDRRLGGAERVKVRAMIEESQPVARIVAKVREDNKVADDDDEAFVKAVEKRIGRSLTLDEKKRVLRLRKQGRSAAEVTELLRS